MSKSAPTFLDHFARLGIYNKVLLLAKPTTEEDDDDTKDNVRGMRYCWGGRMRLRVGGRLLFLSLSIATQKDTFTFQIRFYYVRITSQISTLLILLS